MAEDKKVEETKAPEISEPEALKFTDEELQSLQSLQNNYQEKQVALGQLAVQKILANQQSEAIETRMVELEQEYMNVQQGGDISNFDPNMTNRTFGCRQPEWSPNCV